MDEALHHSFPAVRGIQAGREYFVSMCPLHLIPRLFTFNDEDLTPELRAQRSLNKVRVPEIARYVTDNPDSYVFSALTACVDADLTFEASPGHRSIGVLKVPMCGRFVINDGQHRRAAIEIALKRSPKLGEESIAVVFFSDIGLARSQQMFADLNRYATRPQTSLSTLYDHRDGAAELVRRLVAESPVFMGLVEMERSTLSPRSRHLFTFSAIYQSTNALLASSNREDFDADLEKVRAYWEAVASQLPEWGHVRTGKQSAADVRLACIHSNGVMLHAFGRLGDALFAARPNDWRLALPALGSLDWSRDNPAWVGRAVVPGKLSKSTKSVILTCNSIKLALGLPLTPDERKLENELSKGDDELQS
jgi:DNA sulfur modification protein DndB